MAWQGAHLRLRLKVDDRMTAQAGDTTELKRALRRELRQQRVRVPASARRRAAQRAATALAHTRDWQRAQHIGLYLAVGSELPTEPLIERARRLGKKLYVPRIGAHGTMHFVAWQPGMRLRSNRHGIGEPPPARERPWRQLDLVIVPVVGFDRAGYRLGAGGGYYDRLFARRIVAHPPCLGWALALQEVAAVPRDAWDRRLDGIITERGIRWPTG